MPDSISAAQPLDAPLGKPYGGGAGYFPIIIPEESNIVINLNDFNFFKTTIENASYGDTIYVMDHLQIEIPAGSNLTVPDGVTLASGRGKNGSLGALIYHDNFIEPVQYGIIRVGNNVQITGLRIRGPNGSNSPDNGNFLNYGILQTNKEKLEIHNCEIYNWYFIAIFATNSDGLNVHHNYIHNNQKPGTGYGVASMWESSIEVRYNIFNFNRHSIAGHGELIRLPSYTAEYNLILPCGNGHRFDMHGFRDRYQDDPDMLNSCNYWEPCNYSGDTLEIHNNTFVTIPNELNYPLIVIRGIPKHNAAITNNNFNGYSQTITQVLFHYLLCDTCTTCEQPASNASVEGPFYSWHGCNYSGILDDPANNITVENNYNEEVFIRQIDWGGDSEGFVIVAPEIKYFNSGTFEYGDFNGDGRTDILNQGYISYSGLTPWEFSTESYNINSNHLVDFNGDGLEDSLQIVHPTTLWPDGCY